MRQQFALPRATLGGSFAPVVQSVHACASFILMLCRTRKAGAGTVHAHQIRNMFCNLAKLFEKRAK